MQLQRVGCTPEERQSGVHRDAEGLAAPTHQESVPDESREGDAGNHHEDDADSGVDVVRQRSTPD